MSSLTSVPPARRRRLAIMLAPLAAVLLVAGVIPTVTGPVLWRVIGVAVAVVALLLVGVVAGLRRSADADESARREAELDAAVLAAAGACGQDCGTGSCGVSDCAARALPRG